MNRLKLEMQRIRFSSLGRNASLLFVGQGISAVCQGLYFILLARLMGSAEYGIYVGAFATVGILSVYSPLGSSYTLIRHVSSSPEEFALYWGNALLTTVTLGSLFTAFLVWMVPHLAKSYPWTLVFCVAMGECLFGQLIAVAAQVFQAFEKMRITALLNLLTNLMRTLLALLLLRYLHHAAARQWVWATLTVSFISCCCALVLVTYFFGRPVLSLRSLRQHFREGIVFAVSSSTSVVYNNIDRSMLGHYGMNAANGIYSMAYRVVDVCTMPIASIHAAAFPRFFRKGVVGVRNTTAYALQILKRTGPLTLLLTAIMILMAPVIPRLVGAGFSESVIALRWLCLLPFFRSFQYSAGDALTGAGYQKLRLLSQAAAAIFNFTTNLYLIPRYGWFGAAWSSLATDGLLGIFNWIALLSVRSKTGCIGTTVSSF